MEQHLARAAENAPTVTYTASGATVLLWGMHATDIAVLLSALASILGVALQFWLAMRRIRVLERQQSATSLAVGAVSESQRHVAKVVNEIKSGDN